ncbi:MAG: 2Fe-2S iron-sulfur cluster binding domain-containing protein [Holosporales bacterium]|nr:2Fe-2S iron-sulfur cluster binding domain-containing protein [Holosporales bacterium]
MTAIIFKKGEEETKVEAENGKTLLEVAHEAGVKLFGGCGGAGVCGTCRVFVDPLFVEKLQEASPEEADLLDILSNGQLNSRLACQIVVTDELDGLTVTLP